MSSDTSSIREGRQIGRFKIVGELGHGGMGSVYVGLDEKLGRRVALKVIRPDQRLDPIRKARFLREAKVLSSMDHPNICLFHDYIEGEQEDCLVLELVEGRNLGEAMEEGLDDQQKMMVAEQLLDVLVAVHGQGVIHRDLKPENIMLVDGGGIKVLDFGLARPLEDPDSLTGEFTAVAARAAAADLESDALEVGSDADARAPGRAVTHHGMVLGTIGYMSPEVARGEPATAASDLYSVGMLLQELFTGSPPIPHELAAPERHRRAMWAEVEPVTGLPAELAALIRRLESLVPENRPTAIDAAEKLRVFRDRPRVQRRRRLVAAVWAILAVFGIGMSVQWLRAERAVRLAEEEAATAREVSDFLVGLFEHASPRVNQGEEITVQELLLRGAETIDEELRDQPAVRARMLHTLGFVRYHLAAYEHAEMLLGKALRIRREVLEPDHPELAESLRYNGLLQREIGNLEAAERLMEESLGIYEAQETNDGLRSSARLLVDLAGIDQDLGRWDRAEVRLLRAVEFLEDQPRPIEAGLTDALFDLSLLYRKLHRPAEAEVSMRRCLELDTAEFGPESLPVAGDLGELAAILGTQGRFDEVDDLAGRSLAIRMKILGPDHPHVGHSSTILGWARSRTERLDEAEVDYRRALAIYVKVYGEDHPYVGDVLHSLGSIAAKRDELDAAADFFNRSVAISIAFRGPEHANVGETKFSLAGVRLRQGRLEEAEELYSSALAISEGALGEDNPRNIEILADYAACLRALDRVADAEELERRADVLRQRSD